MKANKTRLFYLLAAAGFVTAQPQTRQHGLRVGTGSAPLLANSSTCNDVRRLGTVRMIQPDGSSAVVDAATILNTAPPYIEFESWVEELGEDYAESVVQGCTGKRQGETQAVFERYVRDNFRKIYAHYSVTVEVSTAGAYRLTLSGSSAPAPADIRANTDWTVVTPARFPVPQTMRETDELAVDLATYPGSGVKLRDYIHVGSLDKMPKRPDAARDFYAEDAEFTLGQPKLRVNGEARDAVTFPELLRGEVMWLYVPGLGRYIVTYTPHPEAGFERAGELSGTSMTLLVKGNVLRISSRERIAPGGGVYNVYGRLDTAWTPADPRDRDKFLAGTSPAVETALGYQY